MTINLRGEDNLYRNAVLNCIEVLKTFPKTYSREIREFYTEDVVNPNTPCFCVFVDGSDDVLRTSQDLRQIRYTVNIRLSVWYYHGDLTEETKRNEITYVLWEVNKLLKTNITLNGFVPKLGIEVDGGRFASRARGTRVIAGGELKVLVRALYTSTVTS